MGDDLKTTLETLAASMQSLQTAAKANAAAIQALAADRQSSSSNGSRSGTGEHHNDRPPRFQKMDFPRYDGKSDPPHLHQSLRVVLSSAMHHEGGEGMDGILQP
jgi:hypothetical protein